MSIINQSAHLPEFFKIDTGLVDRVGEILESEGWSGSVAIVSGQHFSKKVAARVQTSLKGRFKSHAFEIEASSEAEVEKLRRACQGAGVRLVVSVGGGSVTDVCKRLHRLFNIPSVVVPTVISNDGLVSPISVLSTADGGRDSFPALTPVGAIVDLDVIRAAPPRYLQAAAGDVLSNLSASEDWRRIASADSGDGFNDLAFHLAFGSAQTLVHLPNADFGDEIFLQNLVRCQIYSGLAMSIAGSSRPCSGAEHLISHAIDHLKLNHGLLHGAQVGSISLFILHLLGVELGPAAAFARKLGLELDWRNLSAEIKTRAPEIIAVARTVRPGRRTVLDGYSDAELIDLASTYPDDIKV